MQKRVACITGASSGIGRTSAIALAKTGQWRIVLSGRRQEELEKTARLCQEALVQGGSGSEQEQEDKLTLVVAGDVSVEGNVEALFDAIKETYGKSYSNVQSSKLSTLIECDVMISHNSRPGGHGLQRESIGLSSVSTAHRFLILPLPFLPPRPPAPRTERRNLPPRDPHRRPAHREIPLPHEHQRHRLGPLYQVCDSADEEPRAEGWEDHQ